MTRHLQVDVLLRHDLMHPAGEAVVVGHTHNQVVMAMDPAHAHVLGQILARFEAMADDKAWVIDDAWDPTTWFHTMVDLLAESAMVPDVARTVPGLTLVTGATQ